MRHRAIVCLAVAVAILGMSAQVLIAQSARRGGRRGGGRPRFVDDIFAANLEPAQKEIGVNAEQREKLHDLAEDVNEEWMQSTRAAGIDFQGLSAEERQTKMAEKMAEASKTVNEKFAPKLAAILDQTQVKRVHEIAIQVAGAQALLDAGVQKDLDLTAEQKEKLASIDKDFRKQLMEVPRAERSAKMQELNEEQLRKSTEILSKDQLAHFESLKGKPFDMKLLRPAAGRRSRAGTQSKD